MERVKRTGIMKWVTSPLVVWLCLFCFTDYAFALPQGAKVESGQATFESPDANTLNITAGDKTIINFDSFNIGAKETVRFIQPFDSASVLGRVLGGGMTEISGNLFANGLLFLVNPAGIHFNPTANVQVNQLVASTLALSSRNFLDGNYLFERQAGSPTAFIMNEGNILGKNIALLGSAASNLGVIVAQAGTAHLASGDKATVSFDSRGLLNVAITEETSGKVIGLDGVSVKDAVANAGSIEGKQVLLSAKTAKDIFENAVNQTGIVKATQTVDEGGVIRIVANRNMQVSGTLEAKGGTVEVQSGESLKIDSQLNTAGDATISVEKSLTIGDGVTLRGGNTEYQVGEDWINNGKFIGELSTVSLVSNRAAKVMGQNEFNNFSIVAPGKIVMFDSGNVQTVRGALTLKGDFGNLLTLTSINKKQWTIDPQGTTDIQYTLIGDAKSLSASPLKTLHTSSLGNNTNFDIDPYWIGRGSTDNWSEGANWDTGTKPTTSDTVTFDGTTDHSGYGDQQPNRNSTINQNFTITDLIIDGYLGTITQLGNLTISRLFSQSSGTFTSNNSVSNAPTKTFSAADFSLTGGTFNRFQGDGSSGTPYVVRNVYDLQAMGGMLSANYVLNGNIDASKTTNWNGSAGFMPVGSEDPFSGTFNGNNNAIDKLTINSTNNNTGLFGYVAGSSAIIKNVKLTNVNVFGASEVGGLVGTLASGATISHASVSGTVTAGAGESQCCVGILVGAVSYDSVVTYSSTSGTVAGQGLVGGLVGNNAGSIDHSSSSATVNSAGDRIGAIGGFAGNNDGSIGSSSSSGAVNGEGGSGVGGFVGWNTGGISGSSSTGTVSADGGFYVGGFVGYNIGGIDSSTASQGTVTGGGTVGGFAGQNGDSDSSGTISNSSSSETVTGTVANYPGDIGGFVGLNYAGTISNSTASGSVNATGSNPWGMGGFVGENYGTINGTSSASGTVNADNNDGWIGGFAGENSGTIGDGIHTVSATGTVNAANANTPDGSAIGGFVGMNGGTFANITKASATGNVNAAGSTQVGGFVGRNEAGGTISSSTASKGTVTGESQVGGFAGQNGSNYDDDSYTATISNSSSSETVTGNSQVGGFVGYNHDGTISSSTASGSVNATGSNANTIGGFAGTNDDTIDGTSSASGTVNANNSGGWIAGFVAYNNGTISGTSSASGTVNAAGSSVIGGFVSENFGTIEGTSTATGAVNAAGGNDVAGFAAFNVNIIGDGINTVSATGNVNAAGGTDIGGFVGQNYGSINLATASKGTVTGGSKVGGFVGENWKNPSAFTSSGLGSGTISNSSSSEKVTGDTMVGGFVGWNRGDISSATASKGTVTGNSLVGGFVGFNEVGMISGSTASGSVSATGSAPGYIGGFAGENDAAITGSSSSGAVSAAGGSYVGGFAGAQWGTLYSSYYDIDSVLINGKHQLTAGGIYDGQYQDWIGNGKANLDMNTYFDKPGDYYQINGIGTAGKGDLKYILAFAGDGNNFELTDNINLSSTPGFYIPQFSGEFNGNGHTISNLNINLPTMDNGVGFFGTLSGSSTLVHDLGLLNARVTGRSDVGILAGYNIGGAVSQVYTAGSVTGSQLVGGVVGYNDGNLQNSYSTANVYASAQGGGLVGWNDGTISSSYTTGAVTSSSAGGALVGYNGGGGSVENSFSTNKVNGSAGSLVGSDSGSTSNSVYVDGTSVTLTSMMDPGHAVYGQSEETPLWDISYDSGHAWIMAGLPHLQMEWTANISNVVQLQMMTLDLSANYTLTANINAAETANWNGGKGFKPVGTDGDAFTGTFDGTHGTGRWAINQLTINRPDDSYIGLFGVSGSSASIHDVSLTNVNVTGNTMVGGLVGYNDGSIDTSSSSGHVTGNSLVGGFVGYNYDGKISNSTASGSVNVTGSDSWDIGGFAGENDATIDGTSSASGTVNGADAHAVGGFVGFNDGTIGDGINTVSATGTVNSVGGQEVGGFVGINDVGSNITLASATGNVNAANIEQVGGFAGQNFGTISSSTASKGTVTGGSYVGGFVGWNGYYDDFSDWTGTISDSSSSEKVTGNDHVGGFVGQNVYGTISDSTASGSVTRNGTGAFIGGFAGENDDTIDGTSSATGSVTVSGDNSSEIGGFVGYNKSGASISGSSSAGKVTITGSGSGAIGGFVGENDGSIDTSSSAGSVRVSGSYIGYIGGFVGDDYGDISGSSSTGAVNAAGGTLVGGFVGMNEEGASISNSYYDIDTVSINGKHQVTVGGIYDAQYQDWISGGKSPLSISSYFTADGDGYYTISNVSELKTMNDLKNILAFSGDGNKFKLINDLNLSPLSGFYVPVFSGEFDGNGHTISNLNLNIPDYYAGFFGKLGGSVHDLGLLNARVTGYSIVGILAGVNEGGGTLERVYTTGSVNGSDTLGGLVGENDGSITNAYSTASVTGHGNDGGNQGGLVGTNSGIISDSYATGTVTRNQATFAIGGLVGGNRGSISNSYSTGAVTGVGSAGGLVGWQNVGASITNSFSTSKVNGAAGSLVESDSGNTSNSVYVDGSTVTLASMMDSGHAVYTAPGSAWDISYDSGHAWIMAGLPHLQIERTNNISNVAQLQMMTLDKTASYTLTGNINAAETSNWNGGAGFMPVGTTNSGDSFAGSFNGNNKTIDKLTINRPDMSWVGFFGQADSNVTIQNVKLTNVNITGGDYTGGFIGDTAYGDIITKVSVSGKVTGGQYVGGFAGGITGANVSNSSAAVITKGGVDVGGFVGYINNGTIEKCSSSGAVGSAGAESLDYVGGFVGDNGGSISDSYATGSVAGHYEVGGFVGQSEGSITNSYATGRVIGIMYVGGFTGLRQSGIISNAFTTSGVSGSSSVGGFFGAGGAASNSYYTDSHQDNDAGKMTASDVSTLLKGSSHSHGVYSGWNFDTVWQARDSALPTLRA